jgi:hypothetical protein
VDWPKIAQANKQSDDHREGLVQLAGVDAYVLKLVQKGMMSLPETFVRLFTAYLDFVLR